MVRYTPAMLVKIEQLFREGGYVVRYEKGTFKPGYCILERKKIIVINRFFETESRINTLLDLLGKVDLNEGSLSEQSLHLFEQLKEVQVKS